METYILCISAMEKRKKRQHSHSASQISLKTTKQLKADSYLKSKQLTKPSALFLIASLIDTPGMGFTNGDRAFPTFRSFSFYPCGNFCLADCSHLSSCCKAYTTRGLGLKKWKCYWLYKQSMPTDGTKCIVNSWAFNS